MKKLPLLFSQLVLLLTLIVTANGVVSAKVASGLQELGGGLSQGQALLEATARLGSEVFSYDDVLGFPLVPKGDTSYLLYQKLKGLKEIHMVLQIMERYLLTRKATRFLRRQAVV